MSERIQESAIDQGIEFFRGWVIMLGTNTRSEELKEIIESVDELNSLREQKIKPTQASEGFSEKSKAQ